MSVKKENSKGSLKKNSVEFSGLSLAYEVAFRWETDGEIGKWANIILKYIAGERNKTRSYLPECRSHQNTQTNKACSQPSQFQDIIA